ncbi:class I SAM-dependent DNA methyltransferase [Ligilactobacillus agilis]|uniref:class I SAM-dependent DNA methyltransferase n=1 Tax=Ligilactobacillus agilis TaxID=1601 RepID=UPI003F88D666
MAIIDYEDKIKEIVNQENHSEFIYDFLAVYNKISKSTVTRLRQGAINMASQPGEVYLKNKLFFKETNGQLLQAYSDLEDRISNIKSQPRYIIVTDYQHLLAKDVQTGDSLDINFTELPQYFDFFLAWNGIEKADFEKENPADLKAAERFAKLFDEISKDNQEADSHGLNLFLIRLLFCLFAEDTGIFEADLFTNFLKQITATDGSDMNSRISELFAYLDKSARTEQVPAYLSRFPYVNGQLFTEPHTDLNFSSKTRELMIEAGELIGWSKVNPDILGSMLQAVASKDKRSHLGMHYTSVPNIMKVIKPLFLDDLRAEFEAAKGNEDKLNALLTRIGKIKFMDPACGSGNFLIITYKELRKLEMDILAELIKIKPATMYIPTVSLAQFYGIEIEDFACDVTRLSLWIADHQMNKELTSRFHDVLRPTLPLQKAGAIVCGNALRLDWEEILPHEKDDEVYLFGNPPYLGYSLQSERQKKDMKSIFEGVLNYKRLDYIAGWFYKASELLSMFNVKIAFVTTNSINQGEQVEILWSVILKNTQIFFAYPSFKWKNNAKRNAGVIVSIIGLESRNKRNKKLLFIDSGYKKVDSISPYLTEGSEQIVKKNRESSLFFLPKITNGSRPVDGGNLILSSEEKQKLIKEIPSSARIIKKMIGSQEFIKGIDRYALWMSSEDYTEFKKYTQIEERVKKVKEFRFKGGNSAQSVKNIPWAFFLRKEFNKSVQEFDFSSGKHMMNILVPRVSSGARLYIPAGMFDENTLISDSAMVIYNSPLWLLGIISSRTHMVWLRTFGGKLKNDFRYSGELVYNTFPVPELSTRRKNEIEDLTLNILDIRDEEGGTLAELYGSPLAEKNPKPMNPRLLKAHQELDKVVDRAYKASGFKDDNERLALLLDMYSKKVSENNER